MEYFGALLLLVVLLDVFRVAERIVIHHLVILAQDCIPCPERRTRFEYLFTFGL